jgi:hypothetical protein
MEKRGESLPEVNVEFQMLSMEDLVVRLSEMKTVPL